MVLVHKERVLWGGVVGGQELRLNGWWDEEQVFFFSFSPGYHTWCTSAVFLFHFFNRVHTPGVPLLFFFFFFNRGTDPGVFNWKTKKPRGRADLLRLPYVVKINHMVKICKISSKNDAHRLSGKRARASVLRAHPPLCASSPHRCSDASVCPASVARQATLFAGGLPAGAFKASGKGAACWHVFFYMLTCDFLACYTPNMHVRKKAYVSILSVFSMYVEIWTCMLTFSHVENFLHVEKKSHVDMQKFSCQHESHHVNMQVLMDGPWPWTILIVE